MWKLSIVDQIVNLEWLSFFDWYDAASLIRNEYREKLSGSNTLPKYFRKLSYKCCAYNINFVYRRQFTPRGVKLQFFSWCSVILSIIDKLNHKITINKGLSRISIYNLVDQMFFVFPNHCISQQQDGLTNHTMVCLNYNHLFQSA